VSIPVDNPSLFPVLPRVLDTIILSFCDDQTVLRMLRVCKAWNRNLALQEAKIVAHENCWGKEEGFPLKLLAIFRRCRLSIRNLPELSFEAVKEDFRQRIVQNRQAGIHEFDGVIGISFGPDRTLQLDTDYVDFLHTRHLSVSIMRFKHKGRPGLVMCLQNRTNSEIGICTIFRRHSHTDEEYQYRSHPYKDYWVVAPMQHNDRRVVPSHLSVVDFETLIPVLSGTDPSVRLIDPPPAPIPLPPPVPPAAPSLINRIFSFLYTTICVFFSWLYRLCGGH
jgi:hypothetical protein